MMAMFRLLCFSCLAAPSAAKDMKEQAGSGYNLPDVLALETCTTKQCLDDWRDEQEAAIKKRVPKAYQHYPLSSIKSSYKQKLARIEEAEAAEKPSPAPAPAPKPEAAERPLPVPGPAPKREAADKPSPAPAPAPKPSLPAPRPPRGAVVIVVDPVWDDVAGYAEKVPLLSEYKIVKVMTRFGKSMSYVSGHLEPYRKFTYNSWTPNATASAEQICPQLKSMDVPVAAVVPTSDGTVALADQLAACTGVRGNPATGPLAEARRDKWVMGEAVRKAGLRSVKEKKVSSWDEAQKFLQSWDPPLSPANPCIFKILAGSSGEGIYKVTGFIEGKKVFEQLDNSKEKFGGVNSLVLIQEYLHGREFAVDSVSRDGVHKVVAVWFEDFRPANGILDQYFGFKMMDPADPLTKTIIDYGSKVLDAIGLRNGAANTEIKYLEEEQTPCLMETNARWAGINWDDGLAVEHACTGIDQVTAAFDAYLDQEAFDRMPAVRPLKQQGAMIMAVNYESGILRGIPGLDAAKKYPSYLSSDGGALTGIGKPLLPTTPGSIPLQIAFAHKDAAVVEADYARIIKLEKEHSFFDLAPSTGEITLTGRHSGLARRFLALFACSVFAIIATAFVIVVVVRREMRDMVADSDTDYMAVESE